MSALDIAAVAIVDLNRRLAECQSTIAARDAEIAELKAAGEMSEHADSDYGFDHVSKGTLVNRINGLKRRLEARDAEIAALKKALAEAADKLEQAVRA